MNSIAEATVREKMSKWATDEQVKAAVDLLDGREIENLSDEEFEPIEKQAIDLALSREIQRMKYFYLKIEDQPTQWTPVDLSKGKDFIDVAIAKNTCMREITGFTYGTKLDPNRPDGSNFGGTGWLTKRVGYVTNIECRASWGFSEDAPQ